MPLDTRIPLAFDQPRMMSPVDAMNVQRGAMQNALMGAQLQNYIKQQQQQQAVLQAYRTPGTLDAGGNLTEDGMRRLMMISPEAAIQARTTMMKQQVARVQLERQVSGLTIDQLKIQKGKSDALYKIGGAAMGVYNEGLAKGLTPDQARVNAQETYNQEREEARTSGYWDAPTFERVVPAQFDPGRVKGQLMKLATPRDILTAEHQKRTEEGQAEGRAEKKRHDLAMEGKGTKSGGKVPSGYEPDPDNPGAVRPIKGGPADTPTEEKLKADFRADYKLRFPMGPVKTGDPDPEKYVEQRLAQWKASRGRGGGGAAPAAGALPAGVPPGSKPIGWSPKGERIYQAPDGQKYAAPK